MSDQRKTHIERLRETELDAGDKKFLDDVELYGWHVIQVRVKEPMLSWSYTIGLYETFRQPEIIVVGLKEGTALYALNEMGDRMKNGIRLVNGDRHKELLSNVECEFRDVEQRWADHVMGYALWFYGGDRFPVMQCVYPDLNDKFPGEKEFDANWRDRQALLYSGAPASRVEDDFWAANDPNSSLFSWKFPVGPHTGIYTTRRIMDGSEPIVYVSHDIEDGAWQFHGPSESKSGDAVLVCLHHILDKDPSINDLVDLPRGWSASRQSPAAPWIREQKPPRSEER
jgi:uncharacterized protein DUF4262